MLAVHAAPLICALIHGSFSASAARGLLQHWKPSPIVTSDGVELLPGATKNMKAYVRASILLNDGHEAFASLDDDGCMNLFIHRENTVVLCLWDAPKEHRHEAVSRLRDWHASTFPDVQVLRFASEGR